MSDFLDHVGASSFVFDAHTSHVHPRPRGDLVLCDGRCGASLRLGEDLSVEQADVFAAICSWLVTSSMLRSFHHCPSCREGVE